MAKVINVQELTCDAAWRLVEQAIENSAYHAQEEFDKLPPLARRIVGCPQNLQEWNLMFDKCGDEVSANFRRVYRTLSEREKPCGRLREVTVVLHVDTTELDAALAKAERLADILRKTSGGGGTE